MANTILEECIEEVKLRLEDLTLTNLGDSRGARAISKVTRDSEGVDETDKPPWITLDADMDDDGDFINIEQIRSVQPIMLAIFDSRNVEPQKLALALEGDIVRGVYTHRTSGDRDVTLNGNAIICRFVRSRKYYSKAGAPDVYVQCLFNIEYRYKINDPTKIV